MDKGIISWCVSTKQQNFRCVLVFPLLEKNLADPDQSVIGEFHRPVLGDCICSVKQVAKHLASLYESDSPFLLSGESKRFVCVVCLL